MRKTFFSLALLFAFGVSASASAQQNCPSRAYWPTNTWRSDSTTVASARATQIKALEDYAFTLVGEDAERKGVRTDAVLIVKGGKIIYERYARGWDAGKKHMSWSSAKSFSSALTGLAVGQGLLSLDASICNYLDGVPTERCNITVKDVLQFGSGIDWAEDYEGSDYQTSSVLAMLYGEGRYDMTKFVVNQGARAEPGELWAYSTGDATLLMAIVDKALRPSFGQSYAWTLLFDRIGMHKTTFERDNAGVPIGGSYLFATARDYARFGYLYLNQGCWEDQQLLPQAWVAASVEVSEPYKKRRLFADETWVNGYMWWLNRAVPEQSVAKPWPDLPDDFFTSVGHWGQYVAVFPSQDLVVVRLGDDRDGSFDVNKFMSLAMEVGQ